MLHLQLLLVAVPTRYDKTQLKKKKERRCVVIVKTAVSWTHSEEEEGLRPVQALHTMWAAAEGTDSVLALVV